MKAWPMIFLAATLLMACHQGENSTPNASQNKEEEMQSVTVEATAAATTEVDSAAGVSGKSNGKFLQAGNKYSLPQNRQLIRTAHLQMDCADFAAFGAQLHALIRSHGAWVEAEEQTESDYSRQNVLEIKVPVEKFDQLIEGVAGLKGKLVEKKVETEDVTNAIVDVQGRLEAKKNIRARYMELLRQAKNMEDILQVQSEINRITEDMESATYNLQNMQAQAAYSTIYFTYTQSLQSSGGYTAPGFFARLWDAVKTGGAGVQNIAIVGAALWPLWLGIAVVALWWKRRRLLASQALRGGATSL